MPEWKTLVCPSCGAKISVDIERNRYTCEYCGNEHIPQFSEVTRSASFARPARKPVSIPLPSGTRVINDGNVLRISRRWFSWKIIPLVFFCIAWDSFLIFWYSMVFGTGAPWIMIVFPIAHLAVGVGLTYSTLAGLINRTYLEVTSKDLAVWHEPLPWPGEVTLQIGEVKQLYAKQSVHHGDNGAHYTYDLYVITRDGQARKLLSGLDDPQIPLFVERQVENWLKIPDVPVAGEIEL